MLKEISKENWITAVKGSRNDSIFINPDFLQPVALAHNSVIKYFFFYLDEMPVMGFACFIRNKDIIIPTHQIYSGVWWDVKFNTIKFRNILIQSLKSLIKMFRNISFRLPPSFDDIRPFQWEGFTYSVNYTYERSTLDLDFEYNIRARTRKAIETGVSCSRGNDFGEIWNFQNADLKRFSRTDQYISKLGNLLCESYDRGFLQIYQAKLGHQIVGSACVLIDKVNAKAYNLLISSANSNYNMGIQVYLYYFIFEDLQNNGINCFDLYGADIKGVADFKSSFGASLRAHYTVHYNKNQDLLKRIKLKAIMRLRKLRSKCV